MSHQDSSPKSQHLKPTEAQLARAVSSTTRIAKIRAKGPSVADIHKEMGGHADVNVAVDASGRVVEGSRIDNMDHAAKQRLSDIMRPVREAEIVAGDERREEMGIDQRAAEARDAKAARNGNATHETHVGYSRRFSSRYDDIDWSKSA